MSETTNTKDIICPHCEHNHDDPHEIAGSTDGEITKFFCEECASVLPEDTHFGLVL